MEKLKFERYHTVDEKKHPSKSSNISLTKTRNMTYNRNIAFKRENGLYKYILKFRIRNLERVVMVTKYKNPSSKIMLP